MARFPYASKTVKPKRNPLDGEAIEYTPGIGVDLIPSEWGLVRGLLGMFNPIYTSVTPSERQQAIFHELIDNEIKDSGLATLWT